MNSEKTETINGFIDHSQRQASKVAGFSLIFALVLVVISNYSVTFRYIVPDAVETARNLVAHKTAFRFNIFCNLIYLATLILMSTSFYVILKPINKNFALASVFTRFVYASMWAIMAINSFYAFRLLGNAEFLPAFDAGQLQALSKLHLSSSWDAYYVGLPFWGLASTIISNLFLKSKYIPKVLAAFGLISSAWCVFCAFTYLIFPGYGDIVHLGLFDVPLTLFELILGFWLLIKGLKVQPPVVK